MPFFCPFFLHFTEKLLKLKKIHIENKKQPLEKLHKQV